MNHYRLGENIEFSNDRDPVLPSHLAGIVNSVGGLNSIQRSHSQLSAASPTALTASPNPAIYGQSVTLTASVEAGMAAVTGGTVNFMNGTTLLGQGTVANGESTFTTTTLPLGDNTLTAVYFGTTNVLGSTSAVAYADVQEATATRLTSSETTTVFGQSFTLTAKVTLKVSSRALVTGFVQFYNGPTALCFSTLTDGIATCSVSTLPVGTSNVSAEYIGDPSYLASVSFPRSQTVEQALTTTSVISSASPSQFLRAVNFAASVTSAYGTPTGTVTFKNGSTVLGVGTLSNGIATFATSALPVGTDNITAVHQTSTDCTTSTSAPLAEVVSPAETQTLMTSQLNPAQYGQTVTLNLTVSNPSGGEPNGVVTLMDGSTAFGTANIFNGSGSVMLMGTGFSYPAVGTHSLTAVFAATADYLSSTSPAVTETIHPASTSIAVSSSLNPAYTISTVTFTANVTAASGIIDPTGNVTFYDGRVMLGTGTLSAGSTSGTAVATFTVNGGLTVGTHSIFAVYSGQTNFAASTSPVLSETVRSLILAR